MSVIICEPNPTCVDPHPARWYCHRGHDAPRGICPLAKCEKAGANRAPDRPIRHEEEN